MYKVLIKLSGAFVQSRELSNEFPSVILVWKKNIEGYQNKVQTPLRIEYVK
jgi:hypothetical protein